MNDCVGINRRSALAALSAAIFSGGLMAQQGWPNRTIRLVVPFAVGGGTDVIARAVASRLSTRLGVAVVVDNKAGAGGSLGTAEVARSQPDGYTLLFASNSNATTVATQNNVSFDFEKELAPVGQIGATPAIWVVRTDSPFTSLQELIAAARAKPHAVKFGSAGVGSYAHLATELLASEAQLQLLHVAYKGTAPAFTDLLGGSIDMVLASYASVTPLLKGGRVRGLSTTLAKRSPLVPHMPTLTEVGLPGAESELWWGLMARSGTPAEIMQRLNAELNAILAQGDMKELLAREVALPVPGTPEAFGKRIADEISIWRKLAKERSIKAE